MIRHRRGGEFLLITQHDHALLSGKFARRVGNAQFAPPAPFEEVVEGIALHDCGWPVHDDLAPTLNARGEPLHVLETPMPLAVRVWGESARRAAERHPYSGLLVSLHVMALSGIAQRTDDPTPHERAYSRTDQFELLKFQHRQIELQEELRRRVGLRTDLPLEMGLAKPGVDPAEDALLFNYHLLKAMDRLSLDLCASDDLFQEVENVYPRVGATPVTLRIGHLGEGSMSVDPWPFDVGVLEFDVPCRRVRGEAFENEAVFREAYAIAPVEAYHVRLTPGGTKPG